MINGKLIEQVEHAKLLGVTLDCHLTWEKHIENICSIVNSRLSLLRRIKPFLSHHCAVDLLCGITAAELHNSYSVALAAD